MGGTIKVAVRDLQGRVRVVQGWTNPLPYIYSKIGFLEGDPHVWDEYLDEFKKEPYFLDDGDHPTALAPWAYGLFVADFQTRQIIHMQGYCSPDGLSLSHFIQGNVEPDIVEHLKAGRIQGIQWVKDGDSIPHLVKTAEEAQQLLDRRDLQVSWFSFDLSPWKVIRFPETRQGNVDLKATLQEHGFTIDDVAWAAWEADQEEGWVDQEVRKN